MSMLDFEKATSDVAGTLAKRHGAGTEKDRLGTEKEATSDFNGAGTEKEAPSEFNEVSSRLPAASL